MIYLVAFVSWVIGVGMGLLYMGHGANCMMRDGNLTMHEDGEWKGPAGKHMTRPGYVEAVEGAVEHLEMAARSGTLHGAAQSALLALHAARIAGPK